MNYDSFTKIQELIERLDGQIDSQKVRKMGNNIFQIINDCLYDDIAIEQFTVALASVLKMPNLCHTHDCNCEDCPNSRFNYFAEEAEKATSEAEEQKVEVKAEVIPAEVEDKWRDAALKVFKKYDNWYGVMSLPSLTSEVLLSLGAQPSNYSKMDNFFKNYLRSPDGKEHFVVTKGRNGGVRLVDPYRKDYDKYK